MFEPRPNAFAPQGPAVCPPGRGRYTRLGAIDPHASPATAAGRGSGLVALARRGAKAAGSGLPCGLTGRQVTALVAACLLGGLMAADAAMAQGMRLGVSSEAHDLYAPGSPGVDRGFQTRTDWGNLTSERWRAGSSEFRQGGLSHAKAAWSSTPNGQELVAGTSALARSDGGHNGFAQASLNAGFHLNVRLSPPSDILAAMLWRDTLLQLGCRDAVVGCVMDVSFAHVTQGRFAYANRSGDRQASFRESLTLSSVLPTGTAQVRTQGEVRVDLQNLQTQANVRYSGDWSAQDMRPFGPTPASQLGLFPTGDARDALDDPQGPLQGWDFRHTAFLTVPMRFTLDFSSDVSFRSWMDGTLEVGLEQLATAGIGPFVYSSSTLSVDFADTSTFSFSRITDPSGVFDFSQTGVELTLSAVPEPPAAWLALGGVLLLWGWRRRVRGA